MTRVPRRSQQDGGRGSIESLYPFLYQGNASLTAILDEAALSTAAKAQEILELRRQTGIRCGGELMSCAKELAARFSAGGRLLAFGNGGSATDAQQLASLFLHPDCDARPLPAISLSSDVAVLTSLANDIGVDVIFARQVAAFGQPGDIAVGMSTSGNSENLLCAFDEARRRGLLTVGIAGYDGGKMGELQSLDYLFVVPSSSVHRIQEAQTTIYHVLWELTVTELGLRTAVP
jgi:D-sedoheptulose 7-phosphate isomerase